MADTDYSTRPIIGRPLTDTLCCVQPLAPNLMPPGYLMSTFIISELIDERKLGQIYFSHCYKQTRQAISLEMCFHTVKTFTPKLRESPMTFILFLSVCFLFETHIVFCAKFSDFGQVALVRHHHPGFPLDGLYHESCNIWVLKGFLDKRRKKD